MGIDTIGVSLCLLKQLRSPVQGTYTYEQELFLDVHRENITVLSGHKIDNTVTMETDVHVVSRN